VSFSIHFSIIGSTLGAHCVLIILKAYVLCRQPVLASRGCHLGGSVPPFWRSGTPGWRGGWKKTLPNENVSKSHISLNRTNAVFFFEVLGCFLAHKKIGKLLLVGYAICRRPLTIVPCIKKCVCWRGSLLSAGTCRCSQLTRFIASSWSNEPLLAFGGCHLECLVPPLWYLGRPFGTSGAPRGTILAYFGTSGPNCRTLWAAGWTRGGLEQDFRRFWIDLGTV